MKADIKALIAKITNTPLVIEKGSSTMENIHWEYRKWSDGTAECWGRMTVTEAGAGGEYVFSLSYPFSFSALPMVNINGRVGSNYSYANYIANEAVDGCYGYVKDETGSSASNTVVVWADIKGRWK